MVTPPEATPLQQVIEGGLALEIRDGVHSTKLVQERVTGEVRCGHPGGQTVVRVWTEAGGSGCGVAGDMVLRGGVGGTHRGGIW